MLLPAVLAKDKAYEAGAREVWFLDADCNVTEGASSNAWIVTKTGVLVTRPLSNRILPGVTRASVLDTARHLQMPVEERVFSLGEVLESGEAFITSATNTVMPVVKIDGHQIGTGRPGTVKMGLRQAFHHIAEISSL